MADKKPLKLETKCYDANGLGYLYGLNQRIPDDDFEKIKPYMKRYGRKDFVNGITEVTGRPEGWRCLESDVSKIEEILGIEDTLEKRNKKVEEAFKDPLKKAQLKDQTFEWLEVLFKKGGTQPAQDLSRLAIHSTKIEMKDGNGAIGYRLMYEDVVDRLIRIYTEENEYTGGSLY